MLIRVMGDGKGDGPDLEKLMIKWEVPKPDDDTSDQEDDVPAPAPPVDAEFGFDLEDGGVVIG